MNFQVEPEFSEQELNTTIESIHMRFQQFYLSCKNDKKIINASEISSGDTLNITLRDGTVKATVKSVDLN